MKITDTILQKLAEGLGWALLRELRRIAVAIERGVDSDREIHGFQPIFQMPPAATPQSAQPEEIESPESGSSSEDRADFMRQHILELLAEEQHIPVSLDTDLVVLGKARGWLGPDGGILMLPQEYQG